MSAAQSKRIDTSAIRFETRLWLAQRISAAVLAFCVVVHLVTIIVAVRHGLSGPEVLARLRSTPAWLVFYLVFVGSVAVHAPIGLRTIAGEWLGWRGRSLDGVVLVIAAVLLALGLRAVAGLFGVRA